MLICSEKCDTKKDKKLKYRRNERGTDFKCEKKDEVSSFPNACEKVFFSECVWFLVEGEFKYNFYRGANYSIKSCST